MTIIDNETIRTEIFNDFKFFDSFLQNPHWTNYVLMYSKINPIEEQNIVDQITYEKISNRYLTGGSFNNKMLKQQ